MSTERTFDPTERHGVFAVGSIFTNAGWIFREQAVADFGIDAQAELTDAGRPTGQLIGIQIKTGLSYFRKANKCFVFYVDEPHMAYWSMHILAVILVMYNPETKTTLWQWANYENALKTKRGWRIDLPHTNVLDNSALEIIRASARTFRRRDDSAAPRTKRPRFDLSIPPDPTLPLRDATQDIPKMADHCLSYYRMVFQPRFNFAVQITQSTPARASDEIRNAFDHLATATLFMIKEKASVDRLGAAHLHILRAKRHILVGAYESNITAIAYRFRAILDLIDNSRMSTILRRRVHRELSKLEERMKRLSRRPHVPIFNPKALDSDIRRMEDAIAEADQLLHAIEQLFWDCTRISAPRKPR